MRKNEIFHTVIFGVLLRMIVIPVGAAYTDIRVNSSNYADSSTHCPQYINDDIQRCVQPVASYMKLFNNPQDGSSNSDQSKLLQLPKIGGKLFEELCKRVHQFEECVKDHRQRCQSHVTISVIEASYGYLCNEGYDTFQNSAECLIELDQQPSVKQCHDITLRNIEKANNQDETSATKTVDDLCSALNSFSSCVMNPIRTICGANAWQAIFRVLRDTTRTLMPGCAFNNNNREATSEENAQRAHTRTQHGHSHHRHRSPLRTPAPSFVTLLPEPTKIEGNWRESAAVYQPKPASYVASRSEPRSNDQSPSMGEGNLGYIQVEVSENRSPMNGDDDDFYRLRNHRRKLKNGAAPVIHTVLHRLFPSMTALILLFVQHIL